MTKKNDASLVGDFMAAHIAKTVGDVEAAEAALEDLLANVRSDERAACIAHLRATGNSFDDDAADTLAGQTGSPAQGSK